MHVFQGAAWLSLKLSRIALGLRVFNGFKRFLWVFTVFKDRSWSLKAFKSFPLAVKGCSCFSGCLSPPACILEAVSRILRFPQGFHGFPWVVVMLKGFQSVFVDFQGGSCIFLWLSTRVRMI